MPTWFRRRTAARADRARRPRGRQSASDRLPPIRPVGCQVPRFDQREPPAGCSAPRRATAQSASQLGRAARMEGDSSLAPPRPGVSTSPERAISGSAPGMSPLATDPEAQVRAQPSPNRHILMAKHGIAEERRPRMLVKRRPRLHQRPPQPAGRPPPRFLSTPAGPGQQVDRTEQTGDVDVVAAGVHHRNLGAVGRGRGRLAGVGQPGGLSQEGRMSARSSTTGPSPLPNRPTTPVPPTCSCTSQPDGRIRPCVLGRSARSVVGPICSRPVMIADEETQRAVGPERIRSRRRHLGAVRAALSGADNRHRRFWAGRVRGRNPRTQWRRPRSSRSWGLRWTRRRPQSGVGARSRGHRSSDPYT